MVFLCQLFNRHKSKPKPTAAGQKCELERDRPQDKLVNTSHPALGALKSALETLKSVSSGIPIGAGLNSVIDPLLAVMLRIEVRRVISSCN